MAKNFEQTGHVVRMTAPAAVSSGDFTVIGDLFGIAQHDAEIGDGLEVGLGGVWRISGLMGSEGDPVFHDGTDLTMDDGSGANAKAGVLLRNGVVRLNSSF